MRKVNGALDGLRPSGTLLQRMFESVGDAISGFGREVLNVAEVTLGVILRDAINGIVGVIQDLIGSIIDAGIEFQTLKIRLTGLNLNETADGIKSYDQAMGEAVAMTKEELTWLQTLGAATPFDPAQIANTYTYARSVGLASDAAKTLTKDILNYTAGMGLSNETLFLVIQNMGQMIQRGKITGTEIKDLARGSLLPLADVYARIAKNMGLTVEQLTKQISSPKGIPAEEFLKAFEQMAEEEPRFVGAAGRMARALVPAFNNVKELFTSIFGLNVATPIFDILGEKIASIVDEFVTFNEQGDLIKTQKWDDLVAAANYLAASIGRVVKELLGFLPTSKSFTDGLIAGIRGLAIWIYIHKNDIVQFFVNIGKAVGGVIEFFGRISSWVAEHKDLIMEFFGALGNILTTVFGRLFGGAFAQGDIMGGILDAIQGFMEFVVANQDQIATWVTAMIRVFVVVELLVTAFNILIGVIVAVGGFVLTIVGMFLAFVGSVLAIIPVMGVLIAIFQILAVAIGTAIAFAAAMIIQFLIFPTVMAIVRQAIVTWVTTALTQFATLKSTIAAKISDIISNVRGRDWTGLGRSMIMGMVSGVVGAAGSLLQAVVNAVRNAYYAATSFLNAQSPSKLYEELGQFTMEGFAQGIQKYAEVAAGAMTNAMQRVTIPAIMAPSMAASLASGGAVTNNNTANNNYNLTVHSASRTEPIIQDYQMLRSMQG